jgi:lipoate-protein ligase A
MRIDDGRLTIAGMKLAAGDAAEVALATQSSIDHRHSSSRAWTLLHDPSPRPGWYNMALDQALLDRAERTGEGFVRLYAWSPWCLSFGRHEPAQRRYDRERIRALGIDTVRRPTGGRAVWHARELTYAVAAPVSWFGGLAMAYRVVHEMLARALGRLGVSATLAPPSTPGPIGAGACFASHAGGEVLAGGRKLVGSAQLRQGSAFLQHGSMLLEDDQRLLAELTLGDTPPRSEITLREAGSRTVTFSDVARAVSDELPAWGGRWDEGIGPDEACALAAPHLMHFKDPDWTWHR